MTMLYRTLFLLITVPVAVSGLAQRSVIIKGQVKAPEVDRAFYDLMVVNKRTHSGFFGNTNGTFMAEVRSTDTLLVGAVGYRTEFIFVPVDHIGEVYEVLVHLKPIQVQLRTVEILPERTLKEIQKDIDALGYEARDYRVSSVDALQSPITFLYEQFSKRERSKRLVAQLQNEDRKRELLRELLHRYVQYDIINLSDASFDDFIDFCNVPEEIIKGLSQYEFLLYVKKKYELYTSLGPTRRH